MSFENWSRFVSETKEKLKPDTGSYGLNVPRKEGVTDEKHKCRKTAKRKK